ncbi:MAG: hypothetical protein CFE21_11760 [Bacteroidetes bacterium B1(2017)]|nr:MAG: hypothetical protein CFE21_11760 [Bacteroidetes bacterium B1(2017)]
MFYEFGSIGAIEWQHQINTMNKLIILAVAAGLTVTSCKKGLEEKFSEAQQANSSTLVSANKMSDIKVPAGFKWETSRDVQVKIASTDARFGNTLHNITVYSADPNQGGIKLAEGAVSTSTPFEATISTANTLKEYYIVKVAPDQSKVMEKIAISGNNAQTTMSVATAPVKLGKTSGGPDCSTGCTQTITSNNTNLNVNNGDVICVTGSNITIGFNANGGTIRICGSNVTVTNANLNNSSTLIVTSTGSASFNNLNQNGTSTTFTNYGTVSMSSSFSPGGTVTNNGTITTTGDYNLNSQSQEVNNGTINVGQSMNINGNTSMTNNGSIVTNQDCKVNGTGLLINNCNLWSKREFHNNGTTRNYSLIKVDAESKINGGSELGLYSGAMFLTYDMTINGTVKGYGSTSLVKVTHDTRINGGGSVINALQYCDVNGIETNHGTIGSGAALGCGLYIPVTACNSVGNGTAPITDTDGDGVADSGDAYPTDPNKAYNNAYGTATVAFEDLYPYKGDYDLNDVVVNYNYNVVTNAANKVVRVEATYVLRATGGSYENGFAVQFPINRSQVSGLTGATLEAGQSKAVVVLFNNMRSEMATWNTISGQPTSANVTYTVAFNVTGLPTLVSFGLGSYNPFIWNNTAGFGRGYEVHLPGKLPTDLANTSLFGTGDDASNLGTGDTYVSSNGRYPWAINTPANFSYPKEKADINTAYTKFASWVTSGGAQYADWYTNGTGYRNAANIY